MPRVVHFDVPVDDPDRAIVFYSTVFGWKIEKWAGPQDYWLIATGGSEQPGIDGGMMKREAPVVTVVNSIDVPSVDDFAERVIAAGGKVVMPKTAIPGVGYLAYCQDTEGNTFGIMQSDESVKATG